MFKVLRSKLKKASALCFLAVIGQETKIIIIIIIIIIMEENKKRWVFNVCLLSYRCQKIKRGT